MLGPLIGRRVLVRRLALEDLPAFVAYRRDPSVARHQSWTPDYDLAMARELLDSQDAAGEGDRPDGALALPVPGSWRQLAIADLATGAMLGDCALHTLVDAPATFELGITLAVPSQGRGYGTEALHLVIGALFHQVGAHRVVAHADDDNLDVHRLLEGLGMRLEGRFVDADWFKERWATLRLYAVLARDWPGD